MTTFTTADREEEYKKILAAAPNQPGYEDAIPIPFAGWVEDVVASPPHIVDSGASVMNNEPVAWLLFRDGGESYPEYTNSYKQMREWETYLGDNERIEPHYTHPAKTLTDEEIANFEWAIKNVLNFSQSEKVVGLDNVIRAILKKASEK